MNLGQTMHELVEERTPFHDRIEPIVAAGGGLTVRCDVTRAEIVGVNLMQLELVDDAARGLNMDEIVHWAEWLCGRVTYLLEPLRLVEFDRRSGQALIRSRSPQRKRENIAYYEMLVDSCHHASLRRFQYRIPARQRGSIEFSLTHDQLETLVDDLVESTTHPGGGPQKPDQRIS